MNIKGFEKLTNDLEVAQKALSEIDGELGTVSFDPNDPASIEAAIQDVENIIDQRLGAYSNNPIIAPLIDEFKERYRGGILEEAAVARIEGKPDED